MTCLGIIGGSGVNLESQFDVVETYEVSTRFGAPSSVVQKISTSEFKFFFLARHGKAHTIAPHQINYRANLQALYSCGSNIVVAINAVGAISKALSVGQLVIPDQLIDYTWGREHTIDIGETESLMHVDFTEPFDNRIRNDLIQVIQKLNLEAVDGAVVGVTQGPRLETAAEIRRLRSDGCDLVGMTSMPEAAIAREMKLRYASICVVSNPAAGILDEKISIEQIEKVLEVRSGFVSSIIMEYAQQLGKS